MMTFKETKDFLCTLSFKDLTNLNKFLQKRFNAHCECIEEMVITLHDHIPQEDMYEELSNILS